MLTWPVKPGRPVWIHDCVGGDGAVKELIRTNDPVLLSWLKALLADRGIESVVFDTHTSVLEGSASAIPRRLMVGDDDHPEARRALAEAGEAPCPPERSGRT